MVVLTQVRVKGDINKCHRLTNKKVLDIYENFNTYNDVVSFRVTSYKIYPNNYNTTVLSTLFLPYLRESYKQILSQIEELQ